MTKRLRRDELVDGELPSVFTSRLQKAGIRQGNYMTVRLARLTPIEECTNIGARIIPYDSSSSLRNECLIRSVPISKPFPLPRCACEVSSLSSAGRNPTRQGSSRNNHSRLCARAIGPNTTSSAGASPVPSCYELVSHFSFSTSSFQC